MSAAAARPLTRVGLTFSSRGLGRAAAGFLVWIAVWQVLTVWGPLASTAGLPTASSTLSSTARLPANPLFWDALRTTLTSVVIALAIIVALGITLGVAMGRSPLVQAVLEPLSQFLRPIPAVVWLPVILLILGPTTELAIALAVIGGIWPVLIQSQVGVRDIDPTLLETGRAMCLSRRLTQTSIVLPSAVPFFATGIRIGASFALMLTIGAGILGGAPGLGRMILVAQQTGDAPRVFGLVLWAGILGVVLNQALSAFESSVSRGRKREDS
jgi:ABC-type nitrate/sulfonate/bicarbonate transport system permease component